MANHRKKKKKNAAAAKQAAAAYKGKNAPINPAASSKKAQDKPEPKKPEQPKKEPTQKEPAKTQPVKKESGKPEKKKADNKKANKKPEGKKASGSKQQKKQPKKSGGSFAEKVKAFGITKIAAIVLAISVLVASICVIVWVQSALFGIPDDAVPEYNGVNISSDLVLPVIEDLANQQEFANRIKRKGDTEAFLYYASDELIFPEKNSQAPLNLVNVSSNNCVIIPSIVDEAGNVCFSTRGLLPGYMLTDIGINNQPYGKQKMKLVVAAYDPNTYELIGVQVSDLTVQVGIEEETSDVQN